MDPKSILIISHICPYPARTGVRVRIAQTVEWLKAQGFEVTYLLQPIEVESNQGLKQLRQTVDRLVVARRDSGLTSTKLRIRRIVARALSVVAPQVYERVRTKPGAMTQATDLRASLYGDLEAPCWPVTVQATRMLTTKYRPRFVLSQLGIFAKCLQVVPEGTVTILDTHELYSQGHEAFDAVHLQAGFRCTVENEKTTLSKAHVLIAIQRNDQATLRQWFPHKQILLMPCTFQQKPLSTVQRRQNSLLYVASAHHFNVHGLKHLLANVWPLLLKKIPSIQLRVVGNLANIEGLQAPQVNYLGLLADSDLELEYQTATAVINPQLAGTGLKIKCVEALGWGCPLITFAAGAVGMEDGNGRALLIAKNDEEFVHHVESVLKQKPLQELLQKESRAYANRNFAPDAAFRDLRELLSNAPITKAA